MKLAYTAFVLTLLLLGACAFLFWQGFQDRNALTNLESRIAEMEGTGGGGLAETTGIGANTGLAEQPAGAAPVLDQTAQHEAMEKARIEAERDTLAAEKAAMQARIDAMEAERAVLERGVAAAAAAQNPSSVTSTTPGALPALTPPPGAPNGASAVSPGLPSTPAVVSKTPPTGEPAPRPKIIDPPLTGPQLTPVQKQIKESPSIGKVQEYFPNEAFVVIDAGSDRRVNAGDEFALRREHYVVGRIRISTVEAGQSVGNVVDGTIPLGMSITSGDSVIMPPSGL